MGFGFKVRKNLSKLIHVCENRSQTHARNEAAGEELEFVILHFSRTDEIGVFELLKQPAVCLFGCVSEILLKFSHYFS